MGMQRSDSSMKLVSFTIRLLDHGSDTGTMVSVLAALRNRFLV